MRMSTEISLAIRDVGKADSGLNLFVVRGPLANCLREMIQHLKDNPLNRRFDICIGKDEEECKARLLLEARTIKSNQSNAMQKLFDDLWTAEELEAMQSSGLEGDDYVAPR